MHKYRDQNYLKVLKVANLNLLISVAILISLIEFFIPITFILPGVKLGLSNIILVIMLRYYALGELVLFQFIKITLIAFLLGVFSIYLFSLVGGFFALFSMYFTYIIFKEKVTDYSLSVIGAIFHNLGQLLWAIFYLQESIFIMYLPVLIFASVVTGLITGHIIVKVRPTFDKRLKND